MVINFFIIQFIKLTKFKVKLFAFTGLELIAIYFSKYFIINLLFIRVVGIFHQIKNKCLLNIHQTVNTFF